MGATRKTRSRRVRRILSGVLAGALMLGGATVLALSEASPAAAAMTFTSPAPGAIIGTTVIEFEGTADPNEPVRVDPDTNGMICNTTADAVGNWQCFVTFTHSGTLIGIQALGLTSGLIANINITVSLQPVITATPVTPGFVYSNVDPPSVSGTTEPLATINGTIGGQNCNVVANGAGAFTCTALTGIGVDGDHAILLTSTPTLTGVASAFNDSILYHLDTVGPPIPDSTFPFDSNVFPANIDTTDSTPLIGGNAGTADPLGTVTVVADDFGVAPPAHLNGGAGTLYCSGVVASNGSWSCNGAPITLNHYWEFSLFQRDLAGNLSASPDDEFAMRLLPPPPPPVVLLPVIGYQSLSHRVHVSTTNLAEGTMYVREGGADRCTPTPVANPTFACDTVPLAVGVHHLNIFQEDKYGTFTAAVQRTVTILAPPVPKYLTFTFRVIGPDGIEVGEGGLTAGDAVTIKADGLPIGTIISAEFHSTPIALGSTTVGPTGSLSLPVIVPAVDAGPHEIVLAASAPGFEPASATNPVQVRDVKQIPEEPEEVKQLGEPAPELTDGTGGHGSGPGAGGGGLEDPTAFGSSVVSPFVDHSFHFTPAGIVLSGSIAVGFLLLVGFPAELLESTIRSNYDRAFGWLARLRRRAKKLVEPIARALSHPWIGSTITVLVAALLLGFADPGYGFNGASVRLVLAMTLAVVAINIGLNLIVMRVANRAFDVAALLKPMPAALAIVAISVLVSRLAGISPVFLFGVVLGVAYARELKLRDEARLGALGVGLTIAAGLFAWLGYGLASAAASGPGFWNNLLIETLAAITLEALGTLVIALLPIEFLDGRTIFRWSKAAWLGLYALTLLVFLFVVVPLSDNWGTETAPIFGWGTLFAVFAVVAIVTWAVFRRLNRTTSSSREAESPRQRSRR